MALSAPLATAQSLETPYRPMARVFAMASPGLSTISRPPAAAGLAMDDEREAPALFSRKDVWFLAAAATGVAIARTADRSVQLRMNPVSRPNAGRFTSFVRPLGTPRVVGPSLVAGYLAGRIANVPELSDASARVLFAVSVAGAASMVAQVASGRSRPLQFPDGSGEEPGFSGDGTFPSGHTTMAFATARAIDRETESNWVPWLAYPAASLVAWSGVESGEHQVSDVVAGAVLGWFVADKAENLLRRRVAHGSRLSINGKANARARSFRVAAKLKF